MPAFYTGFKPFWNYVSFRISPRAIGGGATFVNTMGLNHIFTQTDVALKYYNFSPTLTRIFNSTEPWETVNFNNHYGTFGKYWICPFENCLIEDTVNNKVTEISPTGARNEFAESGGFYTTPDGINSDLTKTDDEFDLITYSHITYHFKCFDPVTDDTLYQLEYIEDRNGVRIYVERESTKSYRIDKVSGSIDAGATKETLIKFHYTTKTISSTTYYFAVSVTDHIGRKWLYSYNDDGELEQVTYPDGMSYSFEYNNDSFISKITDMRGTAWSYTYGSSAGDLATSYLVVDSTTQTTYYNYNSGTRVSIIRDARSTDNNDQTYEWEYTHDTQGCLTGFDDPLENTTEYEWTSNRLTKIELPNSVEHSSNDYIVLTYDGNNDLTAVQAYDNNSLTYTYNYAYDNYHNLTKNFTNDNGLVGNEYGYDTNHNLVKIVRGLSFLSGSGNPPDAQPKATFIKYDDYGNPTSVTDPNGNTTIN